MDYKIKFMGKYNNGLARKSELIIRLLDLICFTTPEYENSFNIEGYWWILYYGKEPVGYCSLEITSGGWVFLSRAGIVPKHRGKGLQKKFILTRERWCRRNKIDKIKTYIYINNKGSQKNLEKMGYSEYIPKEPWGLPLNNAIYMRKYL